ncbi:MAG: AraC family transcriptional regulator [Halopseudomonas sp.]
MAATVLSATGALIWQALQHEGLDASAIFTEAGLDPDLLVDGNARYPLTGVTKLWALAEQASTDPCFGLSVGKCWSAKNFHALGFAWLASGNAFDALQRLQRYGKLINDALVSKIWVSGKYCHLQIGVESPDASPLDCARIAAISTLTVMLRQLLGENFIAERIELPIARPANALLLENFVGCPVYYQTETMAIVLSLSDCEKPIMGASPELLRANEEVAEAYLARLDKADIKTRVERQIISLLPSGKVDESIVAESLTVSVRTLQRQLKESGASFTGLLQSIRKELAKTYVQDSRLSLTEVTYLLGFSDPANFSRAFKRWFNCAPTTFRKQRIRLSA